MMLLDALNPSAATGRRVAAEPPRTPSEAGPPARKYTVTDGRALRADAAKRLKEITDRVPDPELEGWVSELKQAEWKHGEMARELSIARARARYAAEHTERMDASDFNRYMDARAQAAEQRTSAEELEARVRANLERIAELRELVARRSSEHRAAVLPAIMRRWRTNNARLLDLGRQLQALYAEQELIRETAEDAHRRYSWQHGAGLIRPCLALFRAVQPDSGWSGASFLDRWYDEAKERGEL
jgi:hypothetical protein